MFHIYSYILILELNSFMYLGRNKFQTVTFLTTQRAEGGGRLAQRWLKQHNREQFKCLA